MLRKNLALTFLVTFLIMNEYSFLKAEELTEMEVKKIAKGAIGNIGGKLKHTLMQKVKKDGFASAADFCSTEAGNLAKEATKSLPSGVTVKRITNNPRNILNKASNEDSKILSLMNTNVKEGKTSSMVIKKIATNHYKVYKPIVMGGKCLNCHGDSNTRNKEAYNIIKQKYPNDKAIGYKKGDFRGAFLVEIKR